MACRTDSGTEIDARLMYMFDNVSRWLQFAEAKNGVALTASGGLLVAILGLHWSKEAKGQWHLSLTLLTAGLVVVIGLSLLSFWSKLFIQNTHLTAFLEKVIYERLHNHQREKIKAMEINLLFYGHIRLFSLPCYQKRIQLLLGLDKPLNQWQSALVEQIWINSRITYRKYVYFNISLLTVFATFIAAVVCFLI